MVLYLGMQEISVRMKYTRQAAECSTGCETTNAICNHTVLSRPRGSVNNKFESEEQGSWMREPFKTVLVADGCARCNRVNECKIETYKKQWVLLTT